MRIAFFLEPVIFRSWPCMLEAHFMWVKLVNRACKRAGWDFVLVSNQSLCKKWADLHECERVFEIDSFEVIQSFGYNRNKYTKAIYSKNVDENSYLYKKLKQLEEIFNPNLLITTSQNSFLQEVFPEISILSIEQSPLPRRGYQMRTSFDPCGTQVGSMLEKYSQNILNFKLRPQIKRDLLNILDKIKRDLIFGASAPLQAIKEIKRIKSFGKVALFVLQPNDWVTFEGAYRKINTEDLLFMWAKSLPAGWIGVPTFHPGQAAISKDMRYALNSSLQNIKFLPNNLEVGTADSLVAIADGVVTVSSTVAMTALLFQKPVVTLGINPLKKISGCNIESIHELSTLNENQVASLLCFLTNRFSISNTMLEKNDDLLIEIMLLTVENKRIEEWFLDTSEWNLDRAKSLFQLEEFHL